MFHFPSPSSSCVAFYGFCHQNFPLCGQTEIFSGKIFKKKNPYRTFIISQLIIYQKSVASYIMMCLICWWENPQFLLQFVKHDIFTVGLLIVRFEKRMYGNLVVKQNKGFISLYHILGSWTHFLVDAFCFFVHGDHLVSSLKESFCNLPFLEA